MNKHDRVEKIIYALDLGFSDFFKDENVRDNTLQQKLEVIEQSVEIMKLEEAMNFSIFTTLGENHPTAEVYTIDFPSSLRASLYVLLGGYYRQAIMCLRSWMEIRLTGIYYSFQTSNQYNDWKNGREEGPFGKILIDRLFGRAEFHKKDPILGLRTKLDTIYTELSVFTHGGMLGRYNLQIKTDNVPRFNPQSVEIWISFVKRIFEELVISFFLAYDKNAFSEMTRKEKDSLKNFLSVTYQKELQVKNII